MFSVDSVLLDWVSKVLAGLVQQIAVVCIAAFRQPRLGSAIGTKFTRTLLGTSVTHAVGIGVQSSVKKRALC